MANVFFFCVADIFLPALPVPVQQRQHAPAFGLFSVDVVVRVWTLVFFGVCVCPSHNDIYLWPFPGFCLIVVIQLFWVFCFVFRVVVSDIDFC